MQDREPDLSTSTLYLLKEVRRVISSFVLDTEYANFQQKNLVGHELWKWYSGSFEHFFACSHTYNVKPRFSHKVLTLYVRICFFKKDLDLVITVFTNPTGVTKVKVWLVIRLKIVFTFCMTQHQFTEIIWF